VFRKYSIVKPFTGAEYATNCYTRMIDEFLHHDRAHYDDDGNIILPSNLAEESVDSHCDETTWTTIEDDEDTAFQKEGQCSRLTRHSYPTTKGIWKDVRMKCRHLFHGFLKEGGTQYRWSMRSVRNSYCSCLQSARKSLQLLWSFLTQPVWIIGRNKTVPKQYSRLTLFLLDTVRFGGTFAALFVFLFVSLNYQSFWQMSQSYLHPLSYLQSANARVSSVQSTLNEKLLRSPILATAGASNGDLLSFLPPVGPPQNRMIIPKLGLSTPLVTPSYESLLKEDWAGLEEDIQDALQMGVVHYPGTARPGQAGNFFVTGHSSYYPWSPGKYKTVFARLNELEVGDEYWVYYGGDKYRYIIREKKEVKPTNVNVLDQPVNKRLSTLMTCMPVGTTLRRMIITAEEVDPVTGATLVVGEQHKRESPVLRVESLPI